MNGLIKASDQLATFQRIQLLKEAPAPAKAESVATLERLALRGEVDSLSAELARRNADLDRAADQIAQAFRDGEAKGREAGLAQGDERRADYVEALEQGVRKALDLYAEDLAGLERLAVLVAREALAKVFGDPGRYADMVGEILGRQLEQIEIQGVTRVLVSRTDFPDTAELDALIAKIGHARLDLQARDELKAGECQIKLALGALEIGVGQQWSRLDATLRGLVEREGAS